MNRAGHPRARVAYLLTAIPTPASILRRRFGPHVGVSYEWRTQEFCSGGVQKIQLRTEDRENGDLGAVAS